MQDFINRRGDVLALSAGVLLAIVIIVAYVMDVSSTATSLEKAINPDRAVVPPPVYDIDGAAKLDLKGMGPAR